MYNVINILLLQFFGQISSWSTAFINGTRYAAASRSNERKIVLLCKQTKIKEAMKGKLYYCANKQKSKKQ
jgi:hypothetical protein